MSVRRAFIDIVADDPEAVASFYVGLFGFRATFRSDWFINLAAPEAELLELGILRRGHEAVPSGVGGPPLLTLVVDDVDALFEAARSRGAPIVQPPRDLFYGQRRLLLRDPAGTFVDASSECPPDPAWMARVRQGEDGAYYEAPADDE